MSLTTSLAGSIMFTTYAVYQVVALDLNPFQLLLVGMILEGSVLVFEGLTGALADAYSRRLSVLIGLFVLGAGFVIEGGALWLGGAVSWIPAFFWILVSQSICGIGYTFISGADSAWMVDEVGEEHAGAVFLSAKRMGLIGSLIGIPVSVGLSALAPNLPYLVGGGLYVVLGLVLLRQMKETHRPKPHAGSSAWKAVAGSWVRGVREARRHPVLLLLLGASLFSGAASEGYDRLWQAHLIRDIGFPGGIRWSLPVWLGVIAAATTILGLLAIRSIEARLDFGQERTVFRGLFVLTAVRVGAIAAFAFAPGPLWAFPALLLIQLAGVLNGPFLDTWMNRNLDSGSRATVLSLVSQSDALGQTVGGPFVGWIGKRYSLRASLTAAAALLLPLLGVFSRRKE